ncbi:MAG TPA: hypothetical protein VNV60_02500 [Holophagaceae bacterium]|jgi:hypothetical protein|nr:hypothetical protein [Holophagaceae bacterium]
MLKLAVIGAQGLLGRELAGALEPHASVLPLATAALTRDEEEGDIVLFAPTKELLEGIDAVILTDTPPEGLLEDFTGRILDARPEGAEGEPLPFGPWPADVKRLKLRPAVEQVLALVPKLVSGVGGLRGTHLRAVAHMGDAGVMGLHEQTKAILLGEDPDTESLGYRAAFEIVPQVPRGSLIEVRVPVFHGDLLVLHLTAAEGASLKALDAPNGVAWSKTPPSSREVAVSSDLLANLHPDADGRGATLTLGFDPILWGVLRPVMRAFALMD